MSHRTKPLLFVLLVLGSLTSVATAQAAVATITNGPNMTGTATTSTLFKFHTANKTLSCTTSTSTSTLAGSTGSLPLTASSNLRLGFSGCRIVGGLLVGVDCASWAGGHFTHLWTDFTVSGRTWSLFGAILCHAFVTSQTTCRDFFTGDWTLGHRNPSAGAGARIVIDSNHESMQATNSSDGSGGACTMLPNDNSVRFTDGLGGDPIYTISPTNLTVNVTP
jgi:hypothetical protein